MKTELVNHYQESVIKSVSQLFNVELSTYTDMLNTLIQDFVSQDDTEKEHLRNTLSTYSKLINGLAECNSAYNNLEESRVLI
ncbi:MAG: hypothetical protein ACOYMA_19010 [Bacteroidia bacterium]